ncbi:hypothetical protein C7S18_23010 [Ahniella affigens]|uniref:Class I SAM-dependent methyltransferase n=1 Tax=Ahniella affigens TaxID=2021234 RepID=A0A2P1PYF4_9GAMM|nr:hypothetical protein [Ahniella affigens]AVP99869.1 hypothetical protein C7S18_23010 [Ahniella affigens]
MYELFKSILRATPLWAPLKRQVDRRRDQRALLDWRAAGRPAPPPHIVKQRFLRAHANAFQTPILVETGTFRGDMLAALAADFDKLYSIELSQELWQRARERFADKPHIELIQGDSGVEIKNLLPKLDRPALFWLDGHYSAGDTARGDKDTPILEELAAILEIKAPQHLIVIDDARCFGSDPAYPTIAAITAFVAARRPDLTVSVAEDSIRICPTGRQSPLSD